MILKVDIPTNDKEIQSSSSVIKRNSFLEVVFCYDGICHTAKESCDCQCKSGTEALELDFDFCVLL